MKSTIVANDKVPDTDHLSKPVVATLIQALPLKGKLPAPSSDEGSSNGTEKVVVTTTVLWSERLSSTAVRVHWSYPKDLMERNDIGSSLLLYTSDSTLLDRNWFKILVMEPQRQVTVGGLKPNTNYYFKVYPRTNKTTIRYPSEIEKLDKEEQSVKIEEICLKLCNLQSPKECKANERCTALIELGPNVAVCIPSVRT
uniref:Fibronectin type-III domain-containing protein n=1 Tax=Trichuris muris TaxID=70415 RepID=A0A5S6QLF5_TRIMR